MARLSDRKTLSNEEIEASVEELSRKLEILRVRYEQYFIGVEKVAPSKSCASCAIWNSSR